ncbi:MAG: 4-(cytidine 5'-diphospho)-2-C-methyl-D-erythritol kinase [Candidatus Atribacteria bacterium]|nr:4-(cytidine 5'-diphospho)-2-C-methyl-D-erythritol kinase [Candidatus Atribacteria bacterium]
MENNTSDTLKLKSYAKINLYLSIGQKLNNGYHNIETILQTVDLYDEISLEPIKKPDIYIECNNPEVPTGKKSVMYQAVAMLVANTGKGIRVILNKNIPIASGLGGGSSNIAAIMVGINKIFNLKLSKVQLINMAAEFGMDVPFFITRGTVLAQGRGELIVPLSSVYPPVPLILINPGIKIKSEYAYQLFDQLSDSNKEQAPSVSHFLNKKEAIKPSEIQQVVYNSFDAILSKEYPIIKNIKNRLKNSGASAVALSGSGPTVYGLFEKQGYRDKVYENIREEYPFVYRTCTTQAHKIVFDRFYN